MPSRFMISAMAVPSFMPISPLKLAGVGLGLIWLVGTGIHRSVKRARGLCREALICILTHHSRPPAARGGLGGALAGSFPVSYTHLRAHETRHDLVCRLLLEK